MGGSRIDYVGWIIDYWDNWLCQMAMWLHMIQLFSESLMIESFFFFTPCSEIFCKKNLGFVEDGFIVIILEFQKIHDCNSSCCFFSTSWRIFLTNTTFCYTTNTMFQSAILQNPSLESSKSTHCKHNLSKSTWK